jgi:hypothetical protein
MKIVIVALLGIHGLVHTMGFMGTWGLAQFEGASRTPTNLISAAPGDPIVRLLGIVWLLALVAFVIAASLLVADDAAALLMTEFYRNLQGPNASKARALQQAQLALLKQPRYADPFFWAPFLLINNWL